MHRCCARGCFCHGPSRGRARSASSAAGGTRRWKRCRGAGTRTCCARRRRRWCAAWATGCTPPPSHTYAFTDPTTVNKRYAAYSTLYRRLFDCKNSRGIHPPVRKQTPNIPVHRHPDLHGIPSRFLGDVVSGQGDSPNGILTHGGPSNPRPPELGALRFAVVNGSIAQANAVGRVHGVATELRVQHRIEAVVALAHRPHRRRSDVAAGLDVTVRQPVVGHDSTEGVAIPLHHLGPVEAVTYDRFGAKTRQYGDNTRRVGPPRSRNNHIGVEGLVNVHGAVAGGIHCDNGPVLPHAAAAHDNQAGSDEGRRGPRGPLDLHPCPGGGGGHAGHDARAIRS
eukprot:m.57000 g.57000  ORF g.57000 m.57000 type:complete len:338 (-) comp15599_c0_seq7:1969-2982(-)